MGIIQLPAQRIEELELPAGFSVCELGNQIYHDSDSSYPAKIWYERLGCGSYASLDLNGNGTHKIDLNFPIPYDIGEFDLVTDFGTGEHLFNQAQVFITLHNLCKSCGFIVIDRPMDSFRDHGFYNIQPTLIEDLAYVNGYELMAMLPYDITKTRGDRRKYIGRNLFCIMRKQNNDAFRFPNQGKYRKRLNLPDVSGRADPPVACSE